MSFDDSSRNGRGVSGVASLISAILLILLVAGSIRGQLLMALWPPWYSARPIGNTAGLSLRPLRFERDSMPPDLIAFFDEVERRVPLGASLTVVFPPPWNDPSSGYPRFRMYYMLAGRPLSFGDRADPGALDRSEYVAVWNRPDVPIAGQRIFTGHRGVLTRRVTP